MRMCKLSHVNKLENRVSAGFALNYCSGPADWSLSVVYHSCAGAGAGAGCQRLLQPRAATNSTLYTTTRRRTSTRTPCLSHWTNELLLLSKGPATIKCASDLILRIRVEASFKNSKSVYNIILYSVRYCNPDM